MEKRKGGEGMERDATKGVKSDQGFATVVSNNKGGRKVEGEKISKVAVWIETGMVHGGTTFGRGSRKTKREDVKQEETAKEGKTPPDAHDPRQ